jgi:UDP-GlcNAc:undecaprenyl-phosphate GlcNAc-1-phosphate transferase
MHKNGIIDRAKKEKRKIHKKNIPLGGGFAIFGAFFIALSAVLYAGGIGNEISVKKLIGMFIGGAIVMIGGFLDDKYRFGPLRQIFFPIVASVVAVTFGIGLESITHPSGGVLYLNTFQISVSGLGHWLVLADTLVFCWLMGMMFTTKLLDGMDGLATGIVLIGTGMIYVLSQQPRWFQPEVSILALLFAGSCLGFLVWNFHPAKIFLGEGGSLFIGLSRSLLETMKSLIYVLSSSL